MNEERKSILCIEDDKDTCDLLSFVFQQKGYKVDSCGQTDCLPRVRQEKFLAFILDNYFDGIKGTEISQEIRSFDQVTPIIFFSGEARKAEIEKALATGANAYLIKPNDFEKLAETVISLIQETELTAGTS
jgi:CheY-like chemotaxis protein